MSEFAMGMLAGVGIAVALELLAAAAIVIIVGIRAPEALEEGRKLWRIL